MNSMGRTWIAGGRDGIPPAIAPFSQGVRVGDWIFTAGQGALDAEGQLVGEGDIEMQTRRTLENIRAIIESLGGTLSGVAKMTIWLKDFADYDQMNSVYGEYFPEPAPVRACVQADLVWPDLLVEMEAVAVVDVEPET